MQENWKANTEASNVRFISEYSKVSFNIHPAINIVYFMVTVASIQVYTCHISVGIHLHCSISTGRY